jgi:membrane associated rhomboid family serine protease
MAVIGRPSLFGVIYLAIGVAVAAAYDYFDRVDTSRRILSAVLAVVLWPLLFFGVDLHINK